MNKTVEYKGYTITQSSYNNHCTIIKDNKLVMHLSTTESFSEKKLLNILKLNIDHITLLRVLRKKYEGE